jgi:hypothetical protein
MPVSWGFTGGFVAYTEMSALAPCGRYARMRMASGGGMSAFCEAELACEGPGITAGRVETALQDSAVMQAVRDETTFGVDNRPVDAPIFELRVGYQTVLVGEPCSGQAGCIVTPASVQALVDLLQQLDEQQLALPPCQGMFD